jgi:hypothetical protein
MGQHNREVVETVDRWKRVAARLEAIYYGSLGPFQDCNFEVLPFSTKMAAFTREVSESP